MNPEYIHFFCQPCGQVQRSAIETNRALLGSVELDWQTNTEDQKCGDWSKDGIVSQGHGCREAASTKLVSRGGTPIQHF